MNMGIDYDDNKTLYFDAIIVKMMDDRKEHNVNN